MIDIPLKCQCGSVQGNVRIKSTNTGNHVVCYCVDCQAFGRHLPASEDILDKWGGTEIYQTAPWTVDIHTGKTHLRCLRLKPRGLCRWYTACCGTPVGNTVSAKLPFIGLIHNFIDKGDSSEDLLGPVMGYHKLEDANGQVTKQIADKGMPFSTTIRVFWRIFKWKFSSGSKPSPFYGSDNRPVSKPTILQPGPD